MTPVRLLTRLGACREAIDWARARTGVTDERLWDECDNLQWLLWLLERSRVHDPLTLTDALAPIWRARMIAIHAAWDACYGDDYQWGPFTDERSDALSARYADACERADSNAASMIRHTVARPTREQLVAAAEYWARYNEALPF